MNLSKLSVRRPVTTAMMLLIAILLGAVSIIGLPMDLFPDMELPVALVMTTYSTATPEEVETMVTKPLESQLATVENLDTIYSISSTGVSIVMIQFDMGTDMNFATLNMREKTALAASFLPDDASDPMVMKMDMNSTPIVQLYVSGDMPLTELQAEVEDNISPAFERVTGVASVDVYGGAEEEIAITFQQEKLSGYNLSLSAIGQMLAAENINLPGGSVEKGSTKLSVRTMGEFNSVEEIAQYPITIPTTGEVIRLMDIAEIGQQTEDLTSIARINMDQAININITKQSSSNTVAVSRGVEKVIQEMEEKYPNMEFTIGFNQADYIENSVNSVLESAIQGGILAIVVIFLFLSSVSSTLVIAISIPTSFFATFILMNVTGMSLNMITLSSLTLAVGMLVDNSIVVLENIYRTNQLMDNGQEAAISGATEVFMAIIASTLTSMVVFLPIGLSGGIVGMMFRDFCLTIVFALLASLVVALTVVPMLSSKMLRKTVNRDYLRIGTFRYRYRLIPFFNRFFESLTAAYRNGIRISLRRRKTIMTACILIFVLSCGLIGVVGMELMPASDEGSFTISVETPYGTSLAERDRLASQMEEYLMTIPELEHCSVSISETSMLGSSNTSSISVTLSSKTERDRSTSDIVKEVKKEFSTISGAEISISESSMSSSMMGGSDVTIYLRGSELTILEQISTDLQNQLLDLRGISDVATDFEEGNPEVRVNIDRNMASHYGVTAYQLATGLQSSLSGSSSTNLKVDGEEISINLRLAEEYRTTVENMKQVLISTSTGTQVPVGQIATFEFENSPSSIMRQDQVRIVTLDISIDESIDLGTASTEILSVVNSYPFPDGYSYDTGGQQDSMVEAFTNLLLALVISILLVYMLLAAQFESLTLPFIVMLSIPFAMTGTFLALFLAGMRLSMPAFIGLIMLIGIVVNNSILLIEFIRQYKDEMGRNEAIIEAGRTRFRPIMMTTITTVVGMIPLSLGLGEGGEMLAPMGVSIMGGLLGSTVVTLFIIPVFYAIVDDKREKRKGKKQRREEKIRALEEQWNKEASEHGSAKV